MRLVETLPSPWVGAFVPVRSRFVSLAAPMMLAACVSTPVDPPQEVKTWHPKVNERGITREQAELACRQSMIDAGFGSVVLMSTMVEVCMRGAGFELK